MIMIVAMITLGTAVLMAIIRTALGPTAFDRVLAVNSIGTLVILGIALHGFIMGRPEFVDISILYAILNFIGTIAILKLFSTGSLGDDGVRGGEEG
jgi:multicomponent Na+:H+ antiporter subunit F